MLIGTVRQDAHPTFSGRMTERAFFASDPAMGAWGSAQIAPILSGKLLVTLTLIEAISVVIRNEHA